MSQSLLSGNSGTRTPESQSQVSTPKLASQQDMSSSFLSHKSRTNLGPSSQRVEETSRDLNHDTTGTALTDQRGPEESRFSLTNQSLSSTLFGEVMLRSVQKTRHSSSESRLSLSGSKRALSLSDDNQDTILHHAVEETMPPPSSMGTPQQPPKRRQSILDEESHGALPAGDTAFESFTPSNKAPRTASKLFSPGGFQMMDFINQADSPFQTSPVKTGQTNDNALDTENAKKAIRPQHFFLNLKPNKLPRQSVSIPFLDWTLKDHLSIELQGMAEPNILLSKLIRVDLKHQQQAQASFCRQSCFSLQTCHDTFDAAKETHEEGMIRSSMYWQYPPNDPFATNRRNNGGKRMLATRNSQILQRNSSTTGNSLSFLGKEDASRFGGGSMMHIRSRQASEKLLYWKEKATSLGSDRREWQDAFWSLYGKWRLAVQQLQKDEATIIDDALQVVFYACGLGHTVLFRVGVETMPLVENKGDKQGATTDSKWEEESSSSEGEEDNDFPRPLGYRAEILISSSNSEMRNKLRQMGAKVEFLEGIDGLKPEFDDENAFWSILEQSGHNSTAPEATKTTSPSIVAELVALRREQAMGKTVGADISFKTVAKAKNRKTRISPRRLPPLVISGEDDCACFAEWYLNSYGALTQDPNPLPVLLSRSVGPFLHASLKQSRFQRVARFQEKPALLMKGFVLPCALREKLNRLTEMISSVEPKKGHDTASISIRFRTHSGHDAVPVEGGIGGPSSILFNGGKQEKFATDIRKHNGLCCEFGEAASECVINPSRPNDLTMKVETQTTA